MGFFFCTVVFMYAGRKLGWIVSKPLYLAPVVCIILFGIFWGATIAGSIGGLIYWQEPGVILRWIMGYALGAYVAIPNFGLLNEASVPDEAIVRHVLLKVVPLATYIVCSVALAFLMAT